MWESIFNSPYDRRNLGESDTYRLLRLMAGFNLYEVNEHVTNLIAIPSGNIEDLTWWTNNKRVKDLINEFSRKVLGDYIQSVEDSFIKDCVQLGLISQSPMNSSLIKLTKLGFYFFFLRPRNPDGLKFYEGYKSFCANPEEGPTEQDLLIWLCSEKKPLII